MINKQFFYIENNNHLKILNIDQHYYISAFKYLNFV